MLTEKDTRDRRFNERFRRVCGTRKSLDVTVLHRVIFEKLLGLRGLDHIGYTRDESEAVSAVENGASASFLMNPPSVDDMKGEFAPRRMEMPQKAHLLLS